MTKVVLTITFIFGFFFLSSAQDVKVVGGKEINLSAEVNKLTHFTITLKNQTNNNISFKNIRNSAEEIKFFDEAKDLKIEPNGKIKIKATILPKYSGKQRFQIYLDYNNGSSDGKVYVVVVINP